MAYDFPNPPLTVGQVFNNYTWDGEKWVVASGGGGGSTATSVTFTPTGNVAATNVQAAIAEVDSEKVAKAGDTMSGLLTLSADPTAVLHATTKQYVDNRVVRYDAAQALTAAQQAQARSNVFAAPFDALAYSGMQINGSMDVSQENGANNIVVTSPNTKYIVDGWQVLLINAGKTVTCRQAAGATPNGAGSSLLVEATAGIAAPANGDQVIIRHTIEGYRVARLGWGTPSAQPLSYGFYFFAGSATGTIFVRVCNAAANRLYYVEHAVAAANTWVWCSGTIPGDVTGTWVKDNGVGIYFDIIVMGKSATPATPGAWTSLAANQTTNSTNMFLTTDSYVYVTNLIVIPGADAPSAARSPLIMRPFDQELLLCQRYWEKTYPYADLPGKAYGNDTGGGALQGVVYATTVWGQVQQWYFKANKRAAPNVTIYSPNTGAINKIRNASVPSDVPAQAAQVSESSIFITVNNTSVTGVSFISCHAVADTRVP